MATSSFTSSVSVTKRSAQSLSKVMNKVEKPTLKRAPKINVLKNNSNSIQDLVNKLGK